MDKIEQFKNKLDELKNCSGPLMVCLQEAQNMFGYVCEETMQIIADKLGIKLEEVYQVASFYALFNLQEKGKHKVSVCTGTACYVKGAGAVLDKVEELLGIKEGQTTKDSMFSICSARCVGCCALAPIMIVDEKVYGHMTPDKVEEILNNYREKK